MPTQLVTIPVTTDGAGNFSIKIWAPNAPRLRQYRYVPDGGTPLDTTADITLVCARSGFSYINQLNIGTTAFQKLPRAATHDETGAASLYAAAGEPVEDAMATGPGELTFTVAQGGATKAGTFYFWFGD